MNLTKLDELNDKLLAKTENEWRAGFGCGVDAAVDIIRRAIAQSPKGMELIAVNTAYKELLQRWVES